MPRHYKPRCYQPLTQFCQLPLDDRTICGRGFRNRSGLTQHINVKHRPFAPTTTECDTNQFGPQLLPDPNLADEAETQTDVVEYAQSPVTSGYLERHPILDGAPCDSLGRDLPPGMKPQIPEPANHTQEFYPFTDLAEFSLAEFFYTRNQTPAAQIDHLMDIWACKTPETGPPFADHKDLYDAIDSIELGDAPWNSFGVSYSGNIPSDEDSEVPPWMLAEYEVWYRNPLAVLENQLANPVFKGKFHAAPFREWKSDDERVWGDVMSGNWAWKQADIIAASSEITHGAMFVPVILGSDKTTVSVATGQNEYYPLYISNGVVANSVRRAHKNAVSLLGFLAIPKTDRKYTNDDQFRKFRRQLFHGSLRTILEPLRDAMTKPRVTKCPDGHLRRVIYGVGPYIADYPEQCILASIVSDWCPRCTGKPEDLDGPSLPRTKNYTELLIKYLDLKTLWQDYGVAGEAEPFTSSFPRADIYELVTSDLLHQVIKGTFKDHLVTWVGEWLEIEHGRARATAIMADIDRRIAAVPSFPGLRRFPEGRGFKQWTGNDSKALMKVYLPAIVEHVPEQMVWTLNAFLDFCYLVRRSTHTETALKQIQLALTKFHAERNVFKELGVRPTGLSVPRQHSLIHYLDTIQLFGSPNGLCSSITESKHIKVVKQPYRRTNHYQPLGQMLIINQCLDKLAALRASLESKGLLNKVPEGVEVRKRKAGEGQGEEEEEEDCEAVDGPRRVDNDVFLASTRARRYPSRLENLAAHINVPTLPQLVGRFLHHQLFPNSARSPNTLPLHELPSPDPRSIKVFHSAIAEFYAPSDYSGSGGRKREWIRSTPFWKKSEKPRRDCILVTQDPDAKGMAGMEVARAILFFSFTVAKHQHFPCVLVEWFTTRHRPCPKTRMSIVDRDRGRDGSRTLEVIHIDAVVRSVHLIPVYGEGFIPLDIKFTNSLDRYDTFYVNRYADHHSHEIIF
ncbi:hypothetical protein JOM56_014891 [Amanita muscaria]